MIKFFLVVECDEIKLSTWLHKDAKTFHRLESVGINAYRSLEIGEGEKLNAVRMVARKYSYIYTPGSPLPAHTPSHQSSPIQVSN